MATFKFFVKKLRDFRAPARIPPTALRLPFTARSGNHALFRSMLHQNAKANTGFSRTHSPKVHVPRQEEHPLRRERAAVPLALLLHLRARARPQPLRHGLPALGGPRLRRPRPPHDHLDPGAARRRLLHRRRNPPLRPRPRRRLHLLLLQRQGGTN